MAYLSDILSKVTISIPAKVTISGHKWLLFDACSSGWISLYPCNKDDWNSFSMSTYMATTTAYSGNMRCRDGGSSCYKAEGELCAEGIREIYFRMSDSHYSTEYLLTDAINNLQSAYNPSLYNIFSISTPSVAEGGLEDIFGDVKFHYGNPNQIPTIQVIKGEDTNISIMDSELSSRDYLNRIISDMYNNKITTRSLFVQGEKSNSSPSTFCGGIAGTYDNRIVLPGQLTLTVYLISKSLDLDFTVRDATNDNKDIDNTTPKPEEEKTEDSTDEEDSGDNDTEIMDYSDGGSNITTEINPLIDFDYIYIPDTIHINDIDGIVVGPHIIAGHTVDLDSQNVYIREITQSIKNSDTMTFIEYVKYHEAGIFNIRDKVFGLVYGRTRFKGWIISKQRIINQSEQYIEYVAVGAKSWLSTLPFATNYKTTDKSIYWIFNDISKHISRAIMNERVNLSLLPKDILPIFQLESVSFTYALDSIIDYARKYQWYLDHTGTLRILDMDNLPVIQLSMPSEGSSLTSSYIIKNKNLSVDINDCRTRCILRGDYPIQEYDELKEVIWDSNTYIGSLGTGTININKRIQPNLLTNNSLPVYVYYKIFDYSLNKWVFYPYSVTYVDCNTGEIKILGIKREQLYIRYCVKDELNPLKYDTGWKGTAYSAYKVQQVLIQRDTRFKKIIIPEGTIRDDSQYLSNYAKNLLMPLKDWKIGGSITLDGLNTSLYIGKSVEILNSGCSELSGKHLAVTSITWNFESNETLLNLTNDYYLGSAIIDPIDESKYDERKLIEKVVLSKLKQEEAPWVFNT